MSNKIGFAIVLIALVAAGCAVTAVTMRPTVDAAAQTLVNHAVQPDPLADVLEVRQEAGQNGKVWATVGIVLVGLLAISGVFGYLYLKPRMDKQKRLLLNAMRRQSQPQRPFLPLPQQDVRDLSSVRRPRLVSYVPDMEDGTYE